jgi:hypothetical protein
MRQRGHRARLLLEPAQSVGVSARTVGKDLDRNVPSEPRVARPINLAHASRPQRCDDFVRSQTAASVERHPAILLQPGLEVDLPAPGSQLPASCSSFRYPSAQSQWALTC